MLKTLFQTEDKFYTNLLAILSSLLLIFGLVSVFVRQPASWYDEEIHYVRSLQIANGDILRTKGSDHSQYGGDISVSQNTFIDTAFRSKLFDSQIEAVDLNWEDNYEHLDYTNQETYRVSVTAVGYMPFQYLSFASVAFFNKLFKFDVATEFILMRLVGFLLAYILILLAVRKMPFAKLSLLLLTLCPPYFLSLASVTADSFVFGIIPLFISYTLYLFYKMSSRSESIKNRELISYNIIALLLTLAKPPACLLVALILPLVFLGIRSKKMSTKQVIWLISLIGILAFITLIWLYIVRKVDGRSYFGVLADQGKQLKFMLNNPKTALVVFAKELSNYNFFNMQLGYADKQQYMHLPLLSSYFAFFAIGLSVFMNDSSSLRLEIRNNRFEITLFNIMKILIMIVIILFTFLVLYLQFTPVASATIQGVQPRYFLPYWLLLLTILPKQSFHYKSIVFLTVLIGLIPSCYYLVFVFVQL